MVPRVLEFIKAEWSTLDAEAQREANRILDGFVQLGIENGRRVLPTLSDGEQKRSLARLIARGEGEHLTAVDVTKVLEGATKQEDPVIARASEAFHDALQ